MEGPDASISSRSFREMVLSASIWSMFQQDNRRSSFATADARSRSPGAAQRPGMDGSLENKTGVEPEVAAIEPIPSSSPLVDEEHAAGGKPNSSAPPNKFGAVDDVADPFAGGVEGGIEYKTMVWWHAGMVMVAETISLGILSLPSAMATLGIIPGLVLLMGLGALASYSGYVIGQYKLAHPSIHSWADAGQIMLGKYGREIFGAGQLLFFVFIMGSHILTFAVMMNAITDHGTCTIIYMIVGTILSIIFTLPRTLRNLSYYSITSFVSIIAAVMITMIGVGISRPGGRHDEVHHNWIQDVRLWPKGEVDFHSAFLAMANMVFAYAGHVAFFSFISELKNPRDFPKALAFLQISDISMYIVTAVVIYYYAGDTVTSPALDSASPIVRKVAYGVAIPTIVIAGVVNGHVAVKYLYVRLLRNDKDDTMHQKSFKAIGIWVALCVLLWLVAWIIAESIPVFNDLLGVTSALFASWFTFGLSGIFWFHMNLQRDGKGGWTFSNRRPFTWRTLVAIVMNLVLIIAGIIICVVGLYASGKSIALNSHTRKPFSCKS